MTKYHRPGGKAPDPPSLPIPLPGPGEVDWPSLVDTATRAMGVEESSGPADGGIHSRGPVDGGTDPQAEAGLHGASLGQWVDDVVGHLGLDAG